MSHAAISPDCDTVQVLPVRITCQENENGRFTVSTHIEGLKDADAALAAIAHMEKLLAGNGLRKTARFEIEVL